MSCKSASEGSAKSSGCCGGCQPPFPWFSAILDPVIRRLFFQRYWRELLLGAAAGLLAGAGVLALGEVLGGVGPMLNGSWLHLHPGAVLPTTLLGGLFLALRNPDQTSVARASGWLLLLAALGGSANGLLETGASWSGFLQGGGLISPLAFAVLGLPLLWAFGAAASRLLRPTAEPEAQEPHVCCSEREPATQNRPQEG